MPGAGDLRDLVKIRRPTNTKNPDTGGLDRSWGDLAEVYADVRSINAREAVIGGVLQGISHFQVIIRYRDDVKPSYQLLWKGRELNIHAAEDRLGTREWLTIHASTEAPQAA